MSEPQDEKPLDAESEEMIELEDLIRAKNSKRKAESDEEDAAPPTL